MNPMFVKLRGGLAMGATWSVLWAAAFGGAAIVISVFDPGSFDAGESPWVMAAIGGTVGLISGAIFALALSIAEHGKPLARIPVGHGLAFGAVAGAALPLLSTMPDGNAILTGPLGSLFGAVTIGLAHKAGVNPRCAVFCFAMRHVRRVVQDIAGTPPA